MIEMPLGGPVTEAGIALEEAATYAPGGKPYLGSKRVTYCRDWQLAKVYPASGGPEVRVEVTRLPAKFYRITVPVTGQVWEATSAEDLIAEIATRVAAGDESVAALIAEALELEDGQVFGPSA